MFILQPDHSTQQNTSSPSDLSDNFYFKKIYGICNATYL